MANEAFKQIVRTIKNKISIDKGIVRRPLETALGYVSSLFNYEIKDGTLVVRNGTRVLNSMEDQQFYFIESFKMCNMNILIGLNYKRELWAWLEKWPETDFKVCNTSPFVEYPHRNESGDLSQNSHFSFARGNKFFIDEDDFSIIIVNDYGEAYRIMKVGSIRITNDADIWDQADSINIPRFLVENTGRIWLDIKEATNKVFNRKMFINDDNIRRSHRITGETRFAYVNELGVISELSEPINIEGYRHVVASVFPTVPFNKTNRSITINRTVSYGATASDGKTIYQGNETGIEIGAESGNAWEPVNPYPTKTIDSSWLVMVVSEEGTYTDSLGATTAIPVGIYMTEGTGKVIEPSEAYSYNIISVGIRSGYTPTGLIVGRMYKPSSLEINTWPRIKKTTATDRLTSENGTNRERYLAAEVTIHTDGAWIKLAETVPVLEGVHKYRENFVIIAGAGTERFSIPKGGLYEANILLADSEDVTPLYTWDQSVIFGIELDKTIGTSSWLQWQNEGYDCWRNLGELVAAVSEIDFFTKAFYLDIDSDADVLMAATAEDVLNYQLENNHRIALWNDSHIMGISQRTFRFEEKANIQPWSETNINLPGFPSLSVTRIASQPLMTLDYTGLRRIPMPLPMIRRAMRNPLHFVVTGSSVYVVEENKVWVGLSSDLMLVDYVDLSSAIYSIAKFGSGIIVSTKDGLHFVEKGSDVKRVINGESIIPRFMAKCSSGVVLLDENDVHIIYRHVTETGAWYPNCVKISGNISDANFEGEIKSVSINDTIYIADDYMVWLYDTKNKTWSGQFNYGEYGEKIKSLYVFNNKLGVVYQTGIDREKSFDAPYIPDS